MNIHPVLKETARVLNARGKQAYLVGGAVRDMIRGKASHDWDIATDALPEEIMALFPRVFPSGIKHGTVTVLIRGHSLELTTFRSEGGYSDGRRPDQVIYRASIEEDLSRRDFTMNALAYKLPGGPLSDPYKGRDDIKDRIIRCVGRAEERFAEDGLRPLRAVRFAAQLGFSVDPPTLAAIPGALGLVARVSAERVRDELDKIIAAPVPSAGVLLMEETGLLKLLLPELSRCRGVDQGGFHRFDVLDHSLLACDFAALSAAPAQVRLAALFHDIGKVPRRQSSASGGCTFYGHEGESARMVRDIMTRLRYPKAFTERTVRLVEEHMFHYEDSWGDGAVRRFIIRAGEENLGDLFALRRSDAYAHAGMAPPADLLDPFIRRIEAVLERGRAFTLKDLALSGRELAGIGIAPGRRMGIILRELLEAVVDDPALNRREKLLEIAGNIDRRLGNDPPEQKPGETLE